MRSFALEMTMQHIHDSTVADGDQQIATAQRRLVQMLAKAVAERLVVERRLSELTSSPPKESCDTSRSAHN